MRRQALALSAGSKSSPMRTLIFSKYNRIIISRNPKKGILAIAAKSNYEYGNGVAASKNPFN
jgi:hypothetical protein